MWSCPIVTAPRGPSSATSRLRDGRVGMRTSAGVPYTARSRHRSDQRFIRRNDASSTGVRTLGSRESRRAALPLGANPSSA